MASAKSKCKAKTYAKYRGIKKKNYKVAKYGTIKRNKGYKCFASENNIQKDTM